MQQYFESWFLIIECRATVSKECVYLKNMASAKSLMALTKANKRGRGIDNLLIFKPKEMISKTEYQRKLLDACNFT